MTKLTNKQKKDYAKMLFLRENLTQKEVAEKADVSVVTINKWVNKENWESLKVSITITKEEELKRMYRQLSEINKVIAERKEGTRHASSVEADIISKLSNAISKLETETSVSDIISVSTKFLEWLRPTNLEKAKEIAQYFDAFIKDNLR